MIEAIGTYKIQSTLAVGPRPIYLAIAKDGRKVVIKTAPVKDLSIEERARFEREASICSNLDHPNLVRVIESGEANEVLFQIMEYLEGSDLNKTFGSGRQFSWTDKLSIMEAICSGLQYAHSKGLVHRDIKPANLFLENSGGIRILDFGMAREGSSELTRAGSTVGTLNYMAPEQVRGETCTAATDVFASGIVFHQLCTGVHPFASGKKSLPEILSAILFEQPPAWTAGIDRAPEGLEFVVRRALDKDPAKRWQNAGELKQAISLCRYTLANQPEGEVAAVVVKPSITGDAEKTVVVKREIPRPIAPSLPVIPLQAAVAISTPAVAIPEVMGARFCTSCTFPNPKNAVVCGKCGIPLISGILPGQAASDNRMIWILAGAAALLVVALIVVGVMSR